MPRTEHAIMGENYESFMRSSAIPPSGTTTPSRFICAIPALTPRSPFVITAIYFWFGGATSAPSASLRATATASWPAAAFKSGEATHLCETSVKGKYACILCMSRPKHHILYHFLRCYGLSVKLLVFQAVTVNKPGLPG